MSETLTTYAAMLKEFYSKKKVEALVYENCPLLAQLPKNTTLEGDSWDIPLIYGDGAAASSDFTVAQGNKGAISTAKFQVTTSNEYSMAAFSRKLMKASASDKGAFMKSAKAQVDAAFRRTRNAIGISLFGDGTGLRGTVASYSSEVITLSDSRDATKFSKGMNLQCYDTTASELSLQERTIIAIDRSAGTITVDAAWTFTSAGTVTTGDTLYRAGDKDNVFAGLAGWIPSAAPGATTFYGLNRSVDTDMLGGVRYSAGGQTVRESLIDGQSQVYTIGDGAVDHVYMHPDRFADLIKESDSKAQVSTFKVTDKIGFSGFEVIGNHGVMRVFADRFCSYNSAYLLKLDTWELGSMGPCPDLFDRGTDQEMLREASSDGYEARVGGYLALACHAPGHNGVITWS